MDVRVADNPAEGRFEIFADGKLAGFTRYRASGGHVTFWHTEVDPAFAGLGSAVASRRARSRPSSRRASR